MRLFVQDSKDYRTFVNTRRRWTESFAKESSRWIEDKYKNIEVIGLDNDDIDTRSGYKHDFTYTK
ncbi:unnamed protein product [Sphenostylis stenocarpa]|uniref:Uncharacterized protein n=1 Tax=Sphenostylis stenocarpa TaxID=92480 RepID=A0AA86W4B6_9FABA|nr:unnamed protein product [Sphenostylis stenocarpa]